MNKTMLLLCLLLSACQHPQKRIVTAGARYSVGAAQNATNEARAASERSSAHILKFRDDASRIDYKASRALRLLDYPMTNP